MRNSTSRWRLALGVPLAVTVALALASCSSSTDSSSGGASGNAGGGSSEAALGTANKATGTPVTIGFISDGKGEALDNTDEFKGAQAAAAYANDYLGGIGGHPIEVKVCEARQIPAAATDCSNQMVSANVAAVVQGALAEVDQTIPALTAANIPLLVGIASTQTALTTPGVFSLFNGLSYFGAPAGLAKAEGLKTANMVVIAVPGAEGPARQIGVQLYKNAGVEASVTAVAPGTADMTPQITSAASSKPGMFHVFGNDSFCTSAFKAIKTVAADTKIVAIDRCLDPAAASSIPGGYAGVQVVTTSNLSKDTEEAQLFQAILDKYGDGAKFGTTAAFGYSPMLGMIQALNAAGLTEVTPATILAGIKSAPPTLYPLANGAKFQCNGEQMAISPNICNSDGIIATSDKDGNLSDYQLIAGDPSLYAMPTS
ncbi:ABC transporter substrate-binding protein [Tomitella biformata]|uniref:ABC transporter substrate-binding protein n=1 Tax=Tomitella biformata TaxID=630403 RepID=UPI00130D720B|nr:ABC transporter substrate-binding protein [Tomitella biformata]